MNTLIRFVIFLIFLALVLLGSYFSNYNSIEVPLWFGMDFAPQKVGVWVIIAFSIGGLLGLIIGFGLLRQIKTHLKLIHLKARLKSTEKQLASLRTSTIKDV